ncbi:hypothetical protein Tco_0531995 [Tanacetum coccineum]
MPLALNKVKDPELKAFIEKCIGQKRVRPFASELLNDPFLEIVLSDLYSDSHESRSESEELSDDYDDEDDEDDDGDNASNGSHAPEHASNKKVPIDNIDAISGRIHDPSSLCACTNLESFSRSICGLQCIRKLTVEDTITEAPWVLDQLECLEELMFPYAKIKNLPDSIEAIIPVLQRVKGFGVTLRGVLPLSLVKRHPPRVVGRDAIVYEFKEFRVHTDFAHQKIHNGILGARQLRVQALCNTVLRGELPKILSGYG